MALAHRPGLPAFLIGGITLADLALGRALLRADETRVYLVGRALDWRCAFRAATGLPCPTCGLSRSVVMSLHGEFARAWSMAPAGPVVVVGLAAFALVMLILAYLQRNGMGRWAVFARAFIRKGALAYATAAAVVWLVGWAWGIQAALAAQ